ncbi:MAG TPA: serine protease [Methylomirabilota bacterium]|nr:serine protease [Methylomirabilota bacterium]
MRRTALLLAAAALAAGCAATEPLSRRGDALLGILGPSVQLRTERSGARRAGSGVVVAADAATGRSWIITTRHLFEPAAVQQLWVTTTDGSRRLRATVRATSAEADLAVVEVAERVLPAAVLQDHARLGDEVRVVAFPWGRRLTVVSGIVSQIASEEGVVAVEGAVRMIDASVSYGASGGGVFDASAGTLVGIVESYRTARVALPTEPERVLDLPVPGETTVVGVPVIRRFLESVGVVPAR